MINNEYTLQTEEVNPKDYFKVLELLKQLEMLSVIVLEVKK